MYVERSPVSRAAKMNSAVLFLQGATDLIATPVQAKSMHDGAMANGQPTSLISFEDEGHGFKNRANIGR